MNYENMTRRRVLCFGDSNTYGYDPARDGRYGDDERYPMVLQDLLGDGWSVVEEGLPGRTAVFDDPITEGMNGLRVITPILMSHAPLDTVTIMLGTNDSKARFGCKARMLAFEEVEPEIGHAVGGVCPFGVNDGVTVYLDESLRRFETVFPACGSSNSAIEVTIPELEKFSGFKAWVDICKGWREA